MIAIFDSHERYESRAWWTLVCVAMRLSVKEKMLAIVRDFAKVFALCMTITSSNLYTCILIRFRSTCSYLVLWV